MIGNTVDPCYFVDMSALNGNPPSTKSQTTALG